MLKLKNYQKKAISEFETYLESIRQLGHDLGFLSVTGDNYKSQELGGVPYVCIKIPTGGGKTFVACHMLNSLYEKFVEARNQKGLVLWLVPTTAIKMQTINALKNRSHPYREILDTKFSNNILIRDSIEARLITKNDLKNNLCIIVSTVSTFKSENKESRKVFEQNGNLMDHFVNISNDLLNILEKEKDGKPTISLMNVIRMSNPIIIADEGHHLKTKLTTKMFKNINPIFVLEYTATPMKESNVLVDIIGLDLKDENMIKMPVWIKKITPWQQTIRDGSAQRINLEKIANKEKGEYIRPIVLIQAEYDIPKPNTVHVQKIKEFLISDLNIDEKKIAISTGSIDEVTPLAGKIFDSKCPICYIITVSKLKEGWDNAFAYVLISVANIGKKTSVEQLIGRILRLPYAKKRKNIELNNSYVYTSSPNFEEAANNLKKALLNNGFDENSQQELTDKVYKVDVYKKCNFDTDIKIPFFTIKDKNYRRLEFFEDLVNNQFELIKQKILPTFELPSNKNQLAKIDLDNEGGFTYQRQTLLELVYEFKDFTKSDLLFWLDKHVFLTQYRPQDKQIFLSSIITFLIEKKGKTLRELSISCYKLKSVIENYIQNLEENMAQIQFEKLIKEKKITVNNVFLELPDEITIHNKCDYPFRIHLYEMARKLNGEELELAIKIDDLTNLSWWYRNIEKNKTESLYLQGWHRNKFYPDFIAKTKKGNYLLIEYKGKPFLTNDDTKYKIKLGETWEELAGEKYSFFIVDKNKIDEFIVKIKKL